jgi:hypothetical protein
VAALRGQVTQNLICEDMIKMLSEPIGYHYESLIDYVASLCPVFSLVWPYDMVLDESTIEIHKLLKEYQISEEVIENEWVSDPNAVLPVLRKFKVIPDSIKILKEVPATFACPERESKVSWRIKENRKPGLYSWVSPCLPEDPIFYSNEGQIWFHSVSHEEEAFFLGERISVDEIINEIPFIILEKME